MHRGRWSPAIDTLCIQHGPRPVYPLALLLVTTRGQPGRRARHGGAKLQAGGGGRACSWPAAPPCAAACSAASASRAQALSATAAFRRVSSARWRPMRRSSSRTSRPTCSSLRAALHRSPYPITLPDNPCAPACARGSTARAQHGLRSPLVLLAFVPHTLQLARAARHLTRSTALASTLALQARPARACALLVQPRGALAQHGARGGQPCQALAAGRAGLRRISPTSHACRWTASPML